MKLGLALLLALVTTSARAERSCGTHPAGVEWFYLADPPPQYAKPAGQVLAALRGGLDPELLTRDPSCLRVTVMDDLQRRSHALERPHDPRAHGIPANTVGFHLAKLGSDDAVFVTPSATISLDVVMLHESLHALSHRWSAESQRHHVALFNEAATDYITRELSVLINGHSRQSLHSGYDDGVPVVAALMERLGKEGPQLLADCYLRDGYESFETTVDRRLRVHLGVAARALQEHDAAAAIQMLRAASH